MTDETANAGTPPDAGATDASRPQYRVLSQYVKDLSFESPRPPAELPHTIAAPTIQVSVNVNAKTLNAERTQHEIELSLQARASKDESVVFIAELVYGVVLELINVSEELRGPLTLVEGPRMIFPYARRILADMVRDGGFPPLLIEPIDFAALFRRQLESRAAGAGAPSPKLNA